MRAPLPRLLAFILLLALAGCGGVPIRPAQPQANPAVKPHTEPRPEVGFPAPDFAARDVFTNEEVSLTGLKGTHVVLNFWATWCGPCRAEMPELDQFQKEAKGKVRVVAIGADSTETPAKMGEFVRSLGLSFTVVHDGGEAVLPYRVVGIPTTLLIDAQGVVRAKRMGPVTREILQGWLTQVERLGP